MASNKIDLAQIKLIKQRLKAYNVNNADIAQAFGYKNTHSFDSSARRQQVFAGVEWILTQFEAKKG